MFRIVNILIAVLVLGSAAFAQDDWINHPVKCYRPSRMPTHMLPDSAVEGILTFDPLPVYMQPSRLSVEYYSRFDTEDDVTIQVADYDKSYALTPMEQTWPGPISKGDTLRAEFTIIPRVVGPIKVMFYVARPYEPYEYHGEIRDKISSAILDVVFTLGADGKMMAMNSYATGKDYAPFLGPLPEVMGDSLMFFYYPKIDERYVDLFYNPDYKYRYFSSETVIYTQPDDSGYRLVKCTLFPLHAYDSGAYLEFSASQDIQIKNLSTPVTTPIQPGDAIEYSFDFRKTGTNISRLTIKMLTDNPEEGKHDGEIGNWGKVLIDRMPLYIAHDDNMNLLFITHRDPYVNIPRMLDGRFHTPVHYLNQKDRDPRISWVEEMYKKNR